MDPEPSLRCTSCGTTYNFSLERKLCNRCGSGLWLETGRASLEESNEPGIWRYSGVLPNISRRFRVSLGEGGTMLQRSMGISRMIGLRKLWIKDETVEPTGSYLDRSSALFISTVLNMGYSRVFTYSTGNLGASLAAYSSKAGLKMSVQVKPTIDLGKLYQIIIYGADVSVVESFRKHDARDSAVAIEYDPLINVVKKTLMLEIFLQLGMSLPDYVVLPMGEGGLVYATYMMLRELEEIGYTKDRTRIIGVQPEECKPIVRAFENGSDAVKVEREAKSRIFDLNVTNPRFGNAALRAIRKTGGLGVSVSEREIFEALNLLAEREGVLAEPAGSLSVAGLIKLVRSGILDEDSSVVCVVTGSGLKDPKVMKEIAFRKSGLGELIEELSGGLRLGQTKAAILRLLSEKEMYGYQIWRELREKYGIEIRIPTVYQHLAELIQGGYVKKGGSTLAMGRRREYYTLTEKGEALV
ncbi:MAG: pyridoxal-phosphate dependent enzyme [Thermoproteota archaeon]